MENGYRCQFIRAQDLFDEMYASLADRPATAPSLAPVRSLAYFLPVLEEVLDLNVSPDYFQHVRRRIQRLRPDSSLPPSSH